MLTTSQLPFFHCRTSIEIEKNALCKKDPHYQRMTFLILMLQITLFFNIYLFVLNIVPGQTQLIKTIYLLCNGMLIFLTMTIHLMWMSQHEYSISCEPVNQETPSLNRQRAFD
jgi:hypothetical protein